MLAQQHEVIRLLPRDGGPFAIERVRQSRKSPYDVERQIDRIELNVRQRVDQCGTAFDVAKRALRHFFRRNQQWVSRASGYAGQFSERRLTASEQRLTIYGAYRHCFALNVGLGKSREAEAAQRGRVKSVGRVHPSIVIRARVSSLNTPGRR